MRIPIQSAPVQRDRRLHPYKGILPDAQGVYPALLPSQDDMDDDDDD
jgi:hypothetical protein